MKKLDTVNQILTIEEHNKIKKLIGKCSHLLVREVFSMKSTRLLILLAPLTFGINAKTVPANVVSSTPGENVIVKNETQTPQPDTISDLSSKNTGIPEAQTQNEAKEVASKEVLSEKVEQQPPVVPLPENSKEAELVNKLFDKDGQDVKSKIDIATSESMTPQGEAQKNTVNATPLGVSPSAEGTAQSATPGTTISTPVVSQTKITPTGATPMASGETQTTTPAGENITQISGEAQPNTTPGATTSTPIVSQTNIPVGTTTPISTVPQTIPPSIIAGSPTPPPSVIPATKFATVTPSATQSPTVSQYSNDNFRLLQSGSLALSTNSPQQTNPEIAQNTSKQTVDTTNAELAKEQVSDFLVSQAQNKINETQIQPNALTNQDVQEIRNNTDSINKNVAKIKDSLDLLTLAITDKSRTIDSDFDKLGEPAISSEGKKGESFELFNKEWQDKFDDLDECDETKILDDFAENSAKLSNKKENFSEHYLPEKNEQKEFAISSEGKNGESFELLSKEWQDKFDDLDECDETKILDDFAENSAKSSNKKENFSEHYLPEKNEQKMSDSLETEVSAPESNSAPSASKTGVDNQPLEQSNDFVLSQILREIQEVKASVDNLSKDEYKSGQPAGEKVKKKITSENPASETMPTETSNAELLGTSLINTSTSSDRHDGYSENLTQSKTESEASFQKPAAQDNVKTEEATQTKTESDTSEKQPATQGGGKSDEVSQTNVESTNLAKEISTQSNLKLDEASKTKGDTSHKEAVILDNVKTDNATQTEVTTNTAAEGTITNDTVKSNESKYISSMAASGLSASETKVEEAEKSQQLLPVSTQTEPQESSSADALTEEPMQSTPATSKELEGVKELTSKLKTTMQTISLAKNNLMKKNN